MAKLDFPTLILLVLSFISWLVAMAGTAALTAENGVNGAMVGFSWWAVWFQFFLLIFVGVSACMGSLAASRLRTYMILMATVVWMIVANDARVQLDNNPLATGDIETDLEALLAGAILTLIFNFLFIIYWGLTDHGTQGISLRREGTAPAPEKAVDPAPAVPATV